jgi:hypothetical protein
MYLKPRDLNGFNVSAALKFWLYGEQKRVHTRREKGTRRHLISAIISALHPQPKGGIIN